jgi:hypothetical protein
MLSGFELHRSLCFRAQMAQNQGIVRNSRVEIRVEAVLVLWYFEDD